MRIKSRENPNLEISAFRGHFATRHSHNSHYLDITRMKHEYGMAADAAGILVQHYIYEKQIDTIVCMDGSEVIGTFLARQLSQKTGMVSGKNVLLLISTVNSGKTARRAMECIEYYGGSLQGIAAVFSAIAKVDEVPVMSIFSPEDIPGYMTSLVPDCPLCRAGQKIDALANSYGFSVLK